MNFFNFCFDILSLMNTLYIDAWDRMSRGISFKLHREIYILKIGKKKKTNIIMLIRIFQQKLAGSRGNVKAQLRCCSRWKWHGRVSNLWPMSILRPSIPVSYNFHSRNNSVSLFRGREEVDRSRGYAEKNPLVLRVTRYYVRLTSRRVRS